jgi:hypothetical protein
VTTMNAHATTLATALALIALAPATAPAQNSEASFLTDYSKLQTAKDNPFDEIYASPEGIKRAAQYDSIMIDQPELFIHPDSKYKGMKPDDMKALADALRERVTTELKGSYKIVDKPGANVLYVRLAVGDLLLQKKKRPILAYIPVGAVVYGVKNLASEATSKIDLKNMKIEGEVLDSVSQEQFGAVTSSRGSLSAAASDPKKPVSWNELDNLFSIVGKRLRCRLDNSRIPEAQWAKCGAIGLAPEPTKSAAR